MALEQNPVYVEAGIECVISDAVLDRMMDPEWQHHMYTFRDRDEAREWAAKILIRAHRIAEVDGFVDMTEDSSWARWA